jgi:two-component system, NtrC family, response regulator AtoC
MRAREHGISGITNFPTVGFIDGTFRAHMENSGLGFQCEIDLLAKARSMGLLTVGFCLSVEEAVAMARVPVDIFCLNLGFAEVKPGDSTEHQARLDEAILFIKKAIAGVKRIQKRPYCVVFGGPILYPQDTALVYQRTEALGYIGGSTIERFPTETSITQTVTEFRRATRSHQQPSRLGAMIGRSPAMQAVFDSIRKVADSKCAGVDYCRKWRRQGVGCARSSPPQRSLHEADGLLESRGDFRVSGNVGTFRS